ncbi:MAG: YciI family protein [Alphaproteobacteria bacterium]|nr:YciI family protein [Alphaproteobacteria bacterium]
MRVIVLVKATEDSEKGPDFTSPETLAMMEAMGKYNDALVAAGIMKPGNCEGMKPTSERKRIAFDGAKRSVVNGPFHPAREQSTGYWIWDVKDMDEAVMWAKRCPNTMPGPSEIEICPCYEPEDFQ